MNEKEIIEILENYDNEDNLNKIHKAIQGIRDLYKAEKENNKELLEVLKFRVNCCNELMKQITEEKEKNKDLNERIDLGLDFRNEEIDKYMKDNYISKDKIKAKIEDKKKEAERHIDCVDVTEGQAMYKIVEELGQELLEEE